MSSIDLSTKMKNFTMIPDKLTRTRPVDGKRHKGRGTQMHIMAYLVRAFGYPNMERWDDLTIAQIASQCGYSRKTASRTFNRIVNNWVKEFMVDVMMSYDEDLDLDGLYGYLKRIQRQAKSRVPKPKRLKLVSRCVP